MDTIVYRPYISEAWVSESFGYTEANIEINGKPYLQIILEGEFQRASKPNKNNRIYTETLLSRETAKLQESIRRRNGHPMGMDHPMPNPNDPPQLQLQQIKRIGLENACALTKVLEMNNGVVYGKAEVLTGDGGTGDKLASMVRRKFKPAVSSRGVGGDPVHQNGFMYVPESYNMVCYDFVTDPSTHNAILEQAIQEEVYLMEQATKYVRTLWDVMVDFNNKHGMK